METKELILYGLVAVVGVYLIASVLPFILTGLAFVGAVYLFSEMNKRH